MQLLRRRMNNLCPPRRESGSGSRCVVCRNQLCSRPTVLLFPLPPSMQTHVHTQTEARHLSTLHLSTLYNTLINAGNNRYQGRGRGEGWLHSLANFSPTCALRYKCRANAPSAKYVHTYITERTLPSSSSLSPRSFRAIVKNFNIFKNENLQFK